MVISICLSTFPEVNHYTDRESAHTFPVGKGRTARRGVCFFQNWN